MAMPMIAAAIRFMNPPRFMGFCVPSVSDSGDLDSRALFLGA